jgi:glycosyltransferase involved in cell wall biosynthesis
MKIVHINTTDNRGGAAQIAHLLHRGLNMIPGIQSRMLVREKNSDDPTIDRLAVTGWRRWLSIVTGHDHTFLGGMSLLDHPWVQEADILHLHNLHGYYFHLPAVRELVEKKKVIWTLHDMWTMTGHCGISKAENPEADGMYACESMREYVPIFFPREKGLRASKKMLLGDLAIQYVTPSNWLKKKFEKSYLGTQKITRIANGIDTTIFYNQKEHKDALRIELGFPVESKIIVLPPGSFTDPIKGGEIVKKLITDDRLRHVYFIAIGKSELPENAKLIRLPYTNDKTLIAKYYAVADVFVHPALLDNFPSTVMESLLSGTQVAAFNVGGIPEQVRNGIDGHIVEKNEYDSYVQTILSLLEKPFPHQQIATRAHEEFSSERMVQRYLELYKTL